MQVPVSPCENHAGFAMTNSFRYIINFEKVLYSSHLNVVIIFYMKFFLDIYYLKILHRT